MDRETNASLQTRPRLASYLVHALQVQSERNPTSRWQKLAAFAISFAILSVVSFALLWLGDRINAPGMAVTRILARLQAPAVAIFYPREAQNQIALVLYDQEFLETQGLAWPIRYGDHGDWLLRLVDSEAKPKAIFVDIPFTQNRDDRSLDSLIAAICSITHDHGVPVFMAALPSTRTKGLALRSGLNPDSGDPRGPCFTMVGIGYEPDPVDRILWHYPLTTHLAPEGWKAGPGGGEAVPKYRSAALTLAEDVAKLDLGKETDQLALVWGYDTPDQSGLSPMNAYCQPKKANWLLLIPGFLRTPFESAPQRPVCPYHAAFSMAQIGEFSEDDMKKHLDGRFLIVGAFVPGYNDLVDSPIHGLIPGPYLHAMALDNLLTYQGQYKLSTDWNNPSGDLVVSGLAAIFAVFLVHIALAKARALLVRMGWLPSFLKEDPLPGEKRPVLKGIASLLIWAAKLTLVTIGAVLIIAFLQKFFRIGMLPVVELATMTIAAEALDHLEKIKAFIVSNAILIDRNIRITCKRVRGWFPP